jgi:crotonobetainyl-CoA:carnitine CoA-transferase CaiB-like acyl-CoA transferase
MASTWLLKVDGEPATAKFPMTASPLEGAFECADGKLVYFLCVFPAIVQKTAEVLGCELTRDGVSAALRARPSDEIEASLNAHDLTGVIVRDHATWLRHPQGEVLAPQPVVHIERIGDAPPTPLPIGARPLAGLRVLDATRVIAGPTCTRTLAEFGADVLQIGSPALPDLVASEADTAHGKRRAHIDLNQPASKGQLLDLCRGADVFVQSYRADSLARRGLGPTELTALRPGLIYLSESAYGDEGPWRTKRGFDGNVQAASGILAMHDRNGPPGTGEDSPIAMALNDYCTGYWGAYGVLEALRRRSVEGGSWHVRVSLAQTAMWFLRMGVVHRPEDGMPPREARALVARFSEESDSAYGRLTRLRPAIQMSETPPRWDTPTVRPGHDPCRWC